MGEEHSDDDVRSSAERGQDPDSIDAVFTALRNRDRRYALYFLLEHETVSIEELGDVVTGWTHAAPYGVASRHVRDRTLLDLKHRHIPKLVEAGIASVEDGRVSLESNEPALSFVRKACTGEVRGDREP